MNWEASGGGAFAVIPIEERGKLPEQLPLFRGHTGPVLDTDWSPFDDSLIASGSDDGKVFVWKVPENFTLHTDADEPEDVKPVGKLSGHTRKVGHVLFNPAAENVLASASGDYTIKLWDLEDGKSKLNLKHNDIVQSLSWSANGSMLVTTCRDKKIRFWDVRQQKPAHEVAGHAGAKNSRCVWMGDHDRVATTGFSRMSDRQLGLWDVRNPTKPVGGDFTYLDSISGVCMPFWDDGCQMLYLAGKGDGNIRYYEYENDKFEALSEYKSGEPQRGLAFLPKRGVNLHENEVMRAFKTVNDQYIEPVSFIVPRRAEVFQDDIYPPTVGLKPAMSGSEWFNGKEALPPKISLESLYEGNEPTEVPADAVPKPSAVRETPAPTPAPAAAPAPKAEQKMETSEPTPTVARSQPSMKENKDSMAAMASKFADHDEQDDSDGETSSFEEVQKPVERPVSVAKQETKVSSQPAQSSAPSKTTSAPAPAPEPEAAVGGNFTGETIEPEKTTSVPASELQRKDTNPTPSAAAEGIRGVLGEIRGMLQAQGKQIESLTAEVAALKAKVGD